MCCSLVRGLCCFDTLSCKACSYIPAQVDDTVAGRSRVELCHLLDSLQSACIGCSCQKGVTVVADGEARCLSDLRSWPCPVACRSARRVVLRDKRSSSLFRHCVREQGLDARHTGTILSRYGKSRPYSCSNSTLEVLI